MTKQLSLERWDPREDPGSGECCATVSTDLANHAFYFDSSNLQDYNANSELPGAPHIAALSVPVSCWADRALCR